MVEIQNHFLKFLIFFSAKTMNSFSIIFNFSSLQTVDAITSEYLIQPDDPRFAQLLATHYDCSQQYNRRQFSLTRVQKCTQTASEVKILEHLLLYLFVLKRKELKPFAILQLFKRIESFVLKVHIINGIHMTVWFGILNLCHYQNNWTLKIVKIWFETLMIWIVRNWIKIPTLVLSFILMD